MRICLVLEGCYPYVHGGVSTWMHGYIQAMSEHEFVLWVIGAHAADRGKFVYELPGNVVEVHEVFLDDALRLSGEQHEASFDDREREALRRLVSLSNPDWDVLFDVFHRRRVHPLSFLQSRTFMDIFRDVCLAEYPYTPFADAFHTMRSMLLTVLYLLGSEVPVADVYHAISTGYGGLLACLGSSVHHAPVLLTEHGIYTREREEEIIRADWVVPSFKDRWIRFFYLLSEETYRRAFRVTSLFHNARKTQIDMGCDADKCLVIPNGIQFDRFKDIPLKPDDGWVDIGAVVRLAPIKDVKTMIYAFFELHERAQVRLHIMGGVDDEEYGAECHALVETLGVRDLIFTGRASTWSSTWKARLYHFDEHLSEGQPLSVLESLTARRPCVTTEVAAVASSRRRPGDDFGVAGFVTPPMYRKGLADAMERM
ncbi:MAG: GT4 family glycosyltransferase PelF [Collinsella aerofaciens]